MSESGQKKEAVFDFDKAIEEAVHYRGSFDLLGLKIGKALKSHELPDSSANRSAVAKVVYNLVQQKEKNLLFAQHQSVHDNLIEGYIKAAVDKCFAAASKRTLAEALNLAQVP